MSEPAAILWERVTREEAGESSKEKGEHPLPRGKPLID